MKLGLDGPIEYHINEEFHHDLNKILVISYIDILQALRCGG
jgi:hypothetical protein